MADNDRHLLWCTHCQIEGHEIVQCRVLYRDLMNFAAMTASQSANGLANGVAHWGRTKKKTAINKTSLSGNVYPASAPFVAASSVPSWNPQYPWILNANLTVAEAEMLASHLEQQRLIWLWNREVWTQHTGYNLSGWNASVGDEGWGNHNNND